MVVDLRLEFSWRSSRGFGGLCSAGLEHVHNQSTLQHVEVTANEDGAVDHVTVVPPRGGRGAALLRDCVSIQGFGGETGGVFFVRYTMDDCILLGKACYEACPIRLPASGLGLSGGCNAGLALKQ